MKKIINDAAPVALKFIRDHVRAKGYPPSRRELQAHCGLANVSQAQEVIADLIGRGLIEVDSTIPRGIRVKSAVMKAKTEEM